MPGNREPGMDQDYYAWSPLPHRKQLRWPDGARVAFSVLVSVDYRAIDAPQGDGLVQQLADGPGGAPHPDLGGFTNAEYALRVGIFRVMKVLDKYAIPVAVAMDAAVAERYPFIVAECKRRGWEFIGHGLMANYPLTNRTPAAVERAYIERSLGALEHATGTRPVGWFGHDYQETSQTPAVLRELGVSYVLDWPNDEQPYTMHTEHGELVSLPPLVELDDAYALIHRRVTPWRWEQLVKDAFDTLFEEGAETGKLLVLSLHASVIGRAFRIRSLDNVLGYITAQDGVWKAKAGDIAAWYRKLDS